LDKRIGMAGGKGALTRVTALRLFAAPSW